MSEDQFTKLFKYMQSEFGKIRTDIAAVHSELKADINRVYNLVDADTKAKETDEQERLAMGSQLGRHDAWIQDAAKQLKIKYDSA